MSPAAGQNRRDWIASSAKTDCDRELPGDPAPSIAKSAIGTLGRTELPRVALRTFLGGAVRRVCRPLADISGCVDSRRRIHQAQRPAGFIN